MGSGRAAPVAFHARAADALLVTSDGIASYASEDAMLRVVSDAGDALGWALVDLVRLPSGALRDDVSAIVVRRA